jgi:hypothetical protein
MIDQSFTRIFRRMLFLSVFLSFTAMVSAEGTYLAGTWEFGPWVRAGVLTGDPQFSLINPSPFCFLQCNGTYLSDHLIAEYKAGLGQALIDYRDAKWFHLSALSESTGLAASLPLGPGMNVSLGASQAALISVALSPDIYGSLGFNGVEVEIFPGGEFQYQILPQLQLVAGYGVQMDLNPENIENLDYHHYQFQPWQQCVWLQGNLENDYQVNLRYEPARDQNAYKAGLEKNWGGIQAGLFAELDDSLQPIIEDHRTLSAGIGFPATGYLLTLNIGYDLHKTMIENDFHPQWQMALRLDVPLEGLTRSLTFSDHRDFGNPDHFATYDIQDAQDWNTPFSRAIVRSIRENDFQGFLAQIRNTVHTPQQLLEMAAILSNDLYYFNYADYQRIYDSFVSASAENVISDEQIYNALRQSLISNQAFPVAYCQGFTHLICDVTHSLNIQGMEPYMAIVSYQGFPHVIPLISGPDQIYIVDYGRIIPTATHDIRTALQTYTNLYSYPLFANFLYDKDGRMLRPIFSQDAALLRETMTVMNPPGSEALEALLGKFKPRP